MRYERSAYLRVEIARMTAISSAVTNTKYEKPATASGQGSQSKKP
jgi:hypothetical protein